MLENLKYSFMIPCNILYLSSRLSYCIVNALQSLWKSSLYCGSRLMAADNLEDSQDNGIRKWARFFCHNSVDRKYYCSISQHNGFRFSLWLVQVALAWLDFGTGSSVCAPVYFSSLLGGDPVWFFLVCKLSTLDKKSECNWLLNIFLS